MINSISEDYNELNTYGKIMQYGGLIGCCVITPLLVISGSVGLVPPIAAVISAIAFSIIMFMGEDFQKIAQNMSKKPDNTKEMDDKRWNAEHLKTRGDIEVNGSPIIIGNITEISSDLPIPTSKTNARLDELCFKGTFGKFFYVKLSAFFGL